MLPSLDRLLEHADLCSLERHRERGLMASPFSNRLLLRWYRALYSIQLGKPKEFAGQILFFVTRIPSEFFPLRTKDHHRGPIGKGNICDRDFQLRRTPSGTNSRFMESYLLFGKITTLICDARCITLISSVVKRKEEEEKRVGGREGGRVGGREG